MRRGLGSQARRIAPMLAAALGLGLAMTAADYLHAQAPGAAQDPLISPQERNECLGAGVGRTSRKPATGLIRFVGTEPGRAIPHPRRCASGYRNRHDARSRCAPRQLLDSEPPFQQEATAA